MQVPNGVPAEPAATIRRPCSIRSRPSARPSASDCDAHFTNLDRPVFALVNLPETVKGALFARYSRYPGTLRRLFLDEFADDLPEATPPAPATWATPTRASGPRSSTSASSSATAMTRWPSSAAPTSPANGSPTCSRRSSSGRGSAPTSSSRLATSPTTRRCPARTRRPAIATTATQSSARITSGRWTSCSRSTPPRCPASAPGPRGSSLEPATRRRPPTRARSRPRRSTCCAASCPPARSRTWASSPPARPTSS